MLHQITWPQYLLFAAVALLVYYGIVWLCYFRQEEKTPPKPDQKSFPQADDSDLLGQPADEYGVSTLGSDELNFGPTLTDRNELLQGDIADLLEDLKPAFELIEEQDPENRERLIRLLVTGIRRYPRVLQSDLLEVVLLEICDNALAELSLAISPEELQTALNY